MGKKSSNIKFSENPSGGSQLVQPFLKRYKFHIQSAFYPTFDGTKISLLCSQISHCPFTEQTDSVPQPPTHIFRIYSSIILQSQNVLHDLPHAGLLARIWMGFSNHIYHKCRPFRARWFSTLIIRQSTYYDALLYVNISSFPLYPQMYVQYFLQQPQHLTPLLCGEKVTQNFNTCEKRNIFTQHSSMHSDSWIVDITVGYESYCHWLWFHIF
jgi:hypothetical protein